MDHKSAISPPIARRDDARVRKTRAALSTALLALLAERAFPDISIAMLVERAGVGYATFFRHYRNPQELLLAVAEAKVDALIDTLLPVSGDGPMGMWLLARHVDSDRGFFHALLSGAGDEVREALRRRVLARAAEVDGPMPMRIRPDIALVHITGTVIATVRWWLSEAPELSAEAAGALLHDLAIAPVIDLS